MNTVLIKNIYDNLLKISDYKTTNSILSNGNHCTAEYSTELYWAYGQH